MVLLSTYNICFGFENKKKKSITHSDRRPAVFFYFSLYTPAEYWKAKDF